MTPMDSSLWNLLLRTCSAAGAFLLLVASGIMASILFGLGDDLLPAFLSLLIGTFLSLAALTGYVITSSRSKREAGSLGSVLDQLAKGRLARPEDTGEIFDRVRSVSEYLASNAARLNALAANGRTARPIAGNDVDALGDAIAAHEAMLAAAEQDRNIGETIRGDLAELARLAEALSVFDLSIMWDTRSPEVTPAADAFNIGVSALRSRIQAIRDSVVRLTLATTEFEDIAEQMLRSSSAQSSQIERSAGGIAGLARQMNSMEGRAADALNRANELHFEIAAAGTSADEQLGVMVGLRKQMQENLRKIKKLCERSQELGQLTQAIDDLSERVSMLAMNSSLKGPQSGRYSVEAEQISDRCAKLARHMTALNAKFLVESKEASAAVETSIRGVIHGCALTEASAASAAALETRAAEFSELLEVITASIRYQAKSSHDSAAAMAGIAEVTELIRGSAKRSTASSRQFSQAAAELTAALSTFRLPPERRIRGNETSPDNTRFVH